MPVPDEWSSPVMDEGSAVVDLVLVSLLLMPLFVALLHVGSVLYVRNTLAACAHDAARYAASHDIVTAGPEAIRDAVHRRIDACVPVLVGRRLTVTAEAERTVRTTPDGAAVPVVEVHVSGVLDAIVGTRTIHAAAAVLSEDP
ncbi:MAG: pilus assembly protein [Acidothermus cellulolyticus]|nr:pilus assembly protein [Acidothermus cellulolyticus]